MGLITGLLTLPIAPVRGTIWIADKVLQQAEQEYYDPTAIRRQLEDLDRRRRDGEITEDEAAELEDELVRRLLEAPARRADPKG